MLTVRAWWAGLGTRWRAWLGGWLLAAGMLPPGWRGEGSGVLRVFTGPGGVVVKHVAIRPDRRLQAAGWYVVVDGVYQVGYTHWRQAVLAAYAAGLGKVVA